MAVENKTENGMDGDDYARGKVMIRKTFPPAYCMRFVL